MESHFTFRPSSCPQLEPCPPQKRPLMAPPALIFQTVLSACMWPSQTFACFHTDNRSVSLQASSHGFQHRSRHQITAEMPGSLHCAERSYIPCLGVCFSMHNVAKERLSFAQTAKADVGGRPPPPPLIFFFKHMWENAYDLSKSVKINQSRRLIFSLMITTRAAAWMQSLQCCVRLLFLLHL